MTTIEGTERSCPCKYAEPCKPNCTCSNPVSSAGCARCCTYGSFDQRKKNAHWLAKQEKDAARYRWLRDQEQNRDGLWIAHGVIWNLSCLNGDFADIKIDVAINAVIEGTNDA